MVIEVKDIDNIAIGLVALLQREDVSARVFGGCAIRIMTEYVDIFGRVRTTKDIDLVVRQRELDAAVAVLRNQGWRMSRRGLLMNERRKVEFYDEVSATRLDLYRDPLEFNQVLSIGDRITRNGVCVSWTDMWLLKAQIVEPTEQDLKDLVALSVCVENGEPKALDSKVIERTTGASWGFYHSAITNLDRIARDLEGFGVSTQWTDRVSRSIENVKQQIENGRKSWMWQIRSRIGTRVPWYKSID